MAHRQQGRQGGKYGGGGPSGSSGSGSGQYGGGAGGGRQYGGSSRDGQRGSGYSQRQNPLNQAVEGMQNMSLRDDPSRIATPPLPHVDPRATLDRIQTSTQPQDAEALSPAESDDRKKTPVSYGWDKVNPRPRVLDPPMKGKELFADFQDEADRNGWFLGLRPAFQSLGAKVPIKTNFIEIGASPKAFYEYRIKFEQVAKSSGKGKGKSQSNDQGESSDLRKADKKAAIKASDGVLNDLLAKNNCAKGCWASDWHSNIWTIVPLWTDSDDRRIEVSYVTDNAVCGRAAYTLTAQQIHRCENTLQTIIGSPGSHHNSATITTILNAFISKYASSQRTTVQLGSNKYFAVANLADCGFAPSNVSRRFLEIRGGFTISVRPGVEKCYANINNATTAFLMPLNLADLISRFWDDMFSMSDDQKLKVIRRCLVGVRVRINYERKAADANRNLNEEGKRRKRIAAIGDYAATQQFTMGDGRRINVRQWFVDERQRNGFPTLDPRRITNISLAVNVGNNANPVWVPDVGLDVLENQPAPQSLQQQYVSDIIKYAATSTDISMNKITSKGLKLFGLDSKPSVLSMCHFSVSQDLTNVDGRILAPPVVKYAQALDRINDGSWNMTNSRFQKPFSSAQKPLYIAVVMLKQPVDAQLKKFGLTMLQSFEKLGIGTRVRMCYALIPSNENTERLKEEAFRFLSLNAKQKPAQLPGWMKFFELVPPPGNRPISQVREDQMNKIDTTMVPVFRVVLTFLQHKHEYARIRMLADVEHAINTVCCQINTVTSSGPHRSFDHQKASNIIAKMNVKLEFGCVNHTPDWNGVFGKTKINHAGLIVMGADVTHPSGPSIKGCPSIAAVVGSYEPTMTHFPGSVRLQLSRQERIEEMKEMAAERFASWARRTERLPTQLLFYRDGVSDSQHEEMLGEIRDIEAAYEQVRIARKFPKTTLQIVFVVVKKRHGTRFFPSRETPGSAISSTGKNLRSGLVVDDTITHRHCFDFYCQSQKSFKGTAVPAHYFVLRNDVKLGPNELTAITFAFCHNYQRATVAVGYAQPAYYADRLLDRMRHLFADFLIPTDAVKARYQSTASHTAPMAQRPGEPDTTYARRVLADVVTWRAMWARKPGPWDDSILAPLFYM